MAGNKVRIDVTANTKDAEAGLDRVSKSGQSLGQKMGAVGKKMTVGLTLPLVAAGAAAFKMASDLGEATSQAEQVFGTNASEIIKASENMADSFSQEEFLSMASNLGDIAQGMGFTRESATLLSTDVLSLAQDLGSFKNLPTEQAVQAITAAMTGERESLKSLGIVVNQAMVDERAHADRIAGVTGELTMQEKAQATLALVTEASANAIGDFDRTADGAANKSRILTANFKDMAAKLGQDLIPIGMMLLEWASKLIEVFSNLSPKMQKIILVTAGVVAAIGPLLVIGSRLITVIKGISTASLFLAANPMVALGVAVAAVAAGLWWLSQRGDGANEMLSKMQSQVAEAERKLQGLMMTLGEAGNATTAATAEFLASELQTLGLGEAFVEAGITGTKLVDVFENTFSPSVQEMGQNVHALMGELGLWGTEQMTQRDNLWDLIAALDAAQGSTRLTEALIGDLGSTTAAAAGSVWSLAGALGALGGGTAARRGGVILGDGATSGATVIQVVMPNGDVLAEAVNESNLRIGGT